MRDIIEKSPVGNWVQTERAAHEEWARFLQLKGAVGASRVLHLLLSRMGPHNAVAISEPALAELLDCSERTVRRGVAMLKKHNWIDIGKMGKGSTNVYVINDRIAWSGKRNGIKYSLFSASIVLSETDQPDKVSLSEQAQLRQLPEMFRGEQQLPSGDGLPPPSEPALPGMEPSIPSVVRDEE